MVEIESELIKKYLVYKTPPKQQKALKGRDLQVENADGYGEVLHTHNVRMLKAVYAHFAKNKPQAGAIDIQEAMADAKSSYEAMRDVQEQLNLAYKDLMRND